MLVMKPGEISTFDDDLRGRLKKLASEAGSANKLADMCGIKQTTFSGWIHGPPVPNARDLASIADVVECSLDWLVRGIEPREVAVVGRKRVPKSDERLELVLSWVEDRWGRLDEEERTDFVGSLAHGYDDFRDWKKNHGPGRQTKRSGAVG